MESRSNLDSSHYLHFASLKPDMLKTACCFNVLFLRFTSYTFLALLDQEKEVKVVKKFFSPFIVRNGPLQCVGFDLSHSAAVLG